MKLLFLPILLFPVMAHGAAAVMEGIRAAQATIFVDTTNIRVGIATGAPTQTLDVRGVVFASATSNSIPHYFGVNNTSNVAYFQNLSTNSYSVANFTSSDTTPGTDGIGAGYGYGNSSTSNAFGYAAFVEAYNTLNASFRRLSLIQTNSVGKYLRQMYDLNGDLSFYQRNGVYDTATLVGRMEDATGRWCFGGCTAPASNVTVRDRIGLESSGGSQRLQIVGSETDNTIQTSGGTNLALNVPGGTLKLINTGDTLTIGDTTMTVNGGNIRIGGEVQFGNTGLSGAGNFAEIRLLKSVDGASQSSGCFVAIANAAGQTGNTVSDTLVFTSTNNTTDYKFYGVLMETCAVDSVCRVAVRGFVRVKQTTGCTGGNGNNASVAIVPSITRCQANCLNVNNSSQGTGWMGITNETGNWQWVDRL